MRPATRGTMNSPLRAISCTMPRPMASCDFHRSCAASPGSTNASAMNASAAGENGWSSRMRAKRGSITPEGLFGLLVGFLGVAALELLDAAGRVDDLLLAGVVRVRFRGHLELHHRVLLAVGPFHGLAALGVDGGAGEDAVVHA